MNDTRRAPRAIKMTSGEPRVPEPHPADYSTAIPQANLDLIDKLCDQKQLSSGRTIQRFEW